MKIGLLSLNFGYHGEASAAMRWTAALKAIGHDAQLFTMSRSGRVLKSMRKDVDFLCFGTKKDDHVVELIKFLDSCDVIISYGTGTIGEEEGEDPFYYHHLYLMRTPLIVYFPIGELTKRTYKNTDMFLELPSLVGTMFLRETIHDYFYNHYEYRQPIENKPSLIVNHPFDLTYSTEPSSKLRLSRGVVSAVRIAPGKKVDKLLKAIRDYDLLDIAQFDIWGAIGASRYSWLIEQEYNDFWSELYRGPYTHASLKEVYELAHFSVDLTNFKNDGGIQHNFMESLQHAAIPITPPKWNVREIGIATASLDHEDIACAIVDAVNMPNDEWLERLSKGISYLREEHDPTNQASKLVTYINEVR